MSSFGFSGTNAHVVIEQAPDLVPVAVAARAGGETLVVSGKTPERVASWAAVLADWMDGAGAGVGLADVAHTLNHHRARHGAVRHGVCAGSWAGGGRVAGGGGGPAGGGGGGPA